MTRAEFLDNITDWSELKEFCSEWDCDCCDDIYDEDERDEKIGEDIDEYACDYSWDSLRDLLNDIPSGYDYYCRNSAFSWEEADDEMFERYKSDVCDWADDGGVWDEDEEDEDIFEEEDDIFAEESDETPVEDEDFSVGDLIGMCSVAFVTIQKDNMRKIQEDKRAFDEFVDVNIPKALK